MKSLQELAENRVFYYFEKVCAIPHGSTQEKRMSDALVSFAQEQGLAYRQDETYNVLIKKPASKGYENAPTLILQGHIDMVCEKNTDTVHDFLNDPLQLYVDGDFIKARGTTLGADNGIAVAYMLALLEDKTLAHPPLECIFTTEEEIGMGGAKAFDPSDLQGKRFLNMDTEEEGHLMVSCCGGRRMHIYLPTERTARESDTKPYILRIRGLKGGHSGSDIHLQRANANVLLGRILYEMRERMDFSLVRADGGNMDNAICREAIAVFCIQPKEEAQVVSFLKELEKIFREEYKDRESGIMIEMEKAQEDCADVLTQTARDYVIALLLLLPYGVQTMDTGMEGLVESSSNIGILKTYADHIYIDNAVRSSVESRKEAICRRIEALGALCGARVVAANDYPGWQYHPDSELLEIFKETWKEAFAKEPKVVAIHAGLECGIFAEKIPGLDLISFGPDMFDVHTPEEKLSISSTLRVWKFLQMVLAKLR